MTQTWNLASSRPSSPAISVVIGDLLAANVLSRSKATTRLIIGMCLSEGAGDARTFCVRCSWALVACCGWDDLGNEAREGWWEGPATPGPPSRSSIELSDCQD